ncbi:MAG TPA: response regulator, partial [Candidatus Binatia bacterium]|nr:response regulator [Candidatus Binatia bacterium]
RATARQFDLIVMDIDLPDINGFEICFELKQRQISCDTPVILLSSNAMEERQGKAFEFGAADFIEKPFHVTEFIQSVTLHTKNRRQNQPEAEFECALLLGEVP